MATVEDIFLQELLRVFNNTGGGGVAYGGTGQTGTITGNPTGGSTQSPGSTDPYAGITVVYNPVKDQMTTVDSSLLLSVTTAEGVPIFYGEEMVLNLSPRIVQGEELILYLSPAPKVVQGEELILYLSPAPKVVQGEELILHLSPAPEGGVHGTIQRRDKLGVLQIVEFNIASDANDILSGNGILDGRAGNDGLTGGVGNDTLDGGTGNDWLDGGAGGDVLDGGAGWDVVSYQSATGGVAVDLTTNANGGAAAGDTLSNIEVVQGSNFDDTLIGVHRGGGHGVELHGEGGNDHMRGAAGGDRLYGGAGNDWIAGLEGTDIIDGGDGNDVVGGQEGNDTLSGGAGDDELWGGSGDDIAHGDAGNDAIRGEDGNDKLYGDAGNDWIAGQGGNDFVDGGEGNDVVGGQEGNDTLNGGSGSDELWGGSGADWFLFDTPLSAGADRIMDFSAAEGDMIILNRNVFSALGIGLLSSSAFKVGAATSTSHKILYNSYTGDLSYDVDGWGAAAAIKIAQLNPGTALSASNFFIV